MVKSTFKNHVFVATAGNIGIVDTTGNYTWQCLADLGFENSYQLLQSLLAKANNKVSKDDICLTWEEVS